MRHTSAVWGTASQKTSILRSPRSVWNYDRKSDVLHKRKTIRMAVNPSIANCYLQWPTWQFTIYNRFVYRGLLYTEMDRSESAGFLMNWSWCSRRVFVLLIFNSGNIEAVTLAADAFQITTICLCKHKWENKIKLKIVFNNYESFYFHLCMPSTTNNFGRPTLFPSRLQLL